MDPLDYFQHIDLKAMVKPDFSTLFVDPAVFNHLVNDMAKPFLRDSIDKVACPESMGFIFGAGIARKLKKGLVPIRKSGKLPTIKNRIVRQSFVDYRREKGGFEMNKTLIDEGDRVLLVDDWADTGGQLKGLIKLLEKRGAEIVGISLLGLNQVKKTRGLEEKYKVRAIIKYTEEGERDPSKPLA